MKQAVKHLYPYLPRWITNRIAESREHLRVIDLSRVALLRSADKKILQDPAAMEDFLPTLGLGGYPDDVPEKVRCHIRTGLWHWQSPKQFAPYLVHLSSLPIRGYLEIGVKHGGTFVITIEYLSRFRPIERALGVDANFCPSLLRYHGMNPKAEFLQLNTRDPAFEARVRSSGGFDLVLIDGDHEEEGCRKDFDIVYPFANVLVFHDIVNEFTPGPGAVWRSVKARYADEFEFTEYVDQYPHVIQKVGKGILGLGVAVRKQWRPHAR